MASMPSPRIAALMLVIATAALVITSLLVPERYLATVTGYSQLSYGSRQKQHQSFREHTDNQDVPIQVIILSYMRSGTSFLGKIFDENENVLYVFEPLYSVCESVVPNFKGLELINGTVLMPGTSCNEVGKVIMASYLTCNIPAIDQATLTQLWMTHTKKTRDFYSCQRKSNLTTCVDQFTQVCQRSRAIVLKTIRARLQDIAPTLRALPHLKVIHLVRDPRAVIRSRQLMGEYYHRSVLKTGKQICGDMRRDLHAMREVQREFAGRVLQLRYEDLAQNPIVKARKVYSFVGLPLPDSVEKWMLHNTHADIDDGEKLGTSRANSQQTASKWREDTPWSLVTTMQDSCRDVLENLGYLVCTSPEMLHNLSIPLRRT